MIDFNITFSLFRLGYSKSVLLSVFSSSVDSSPADRLSFSHLASVAGPEATVRVNRLFSDPPVSDSSPGTEDAVSAKYMTQARALTTKLSTWHKLGYVNPKNTSYVSRFYYIFSFLFFRYINVCDKNTNICNVSFSIMLWPRYVFHECFFDLKRISFKLFFIHTLILDPVLARRSNFSLSFETVIK